MGLRDLLNRMVMNGGRTLLSALHGSEGNLSTLGPKLDRLRFQFEKCRSKIFFSLLLKFLFKSGLDLFPFRLKTDGRSLKKILICCNHSIPDSTGTRPKPDA